MKRTVGLFVLTFFIIILGSLFFLLKEKGTFEKRYSYSFETDSAEYFQLGMPVKFSGFNIGLIDDIKLNDNGSVHVAFSVQKKYKKFLSEGSVLIIIKPLIGSPHIDLFTSVDTPLLKENASLTLISSDNINDIIMSLQPVVQKAKAILDNVHTITNYLASEDSELIQILQNMNTLSAKLAKNDSLLTSLTGSKKATKDIITSINETKHIMQNIKKITHDMSKITKALNKTIIQPSSATIKEINKIMKDIKKKLGSYDKDLLQLKEQITVGVAKSNQIIDKVDALMATESDAEIQLP
ncbi:MCE family protein [Sulfurimonas sp. SAG-AH-194-I05]|nr:MCE family protein [Sulfurimonas sp. SAG-AH-194-I05]